MKILTSNILFILVAGALTIGIGATTFTLSSPDRKSVTEQNNLQVKKPVTTKTSNTPTDSANTAKSYTASDVALHKDQASCWTIVNGNVYDLTSWIAKHPGGEGAILSICGVNGSAAFNNQHGGASRPEQILKSYFIGILK